MASDIDTTQVKAVDIQSSWAGGMNLVRSPNAIGADQCQWMENCYGRGTALVKAKGQRPASRLEIGAYYKEKWDGESVDLSVWAVYQTGLGATVTADPDNRECDIQGPTSGNAWNSSGIILKSLTQKGTLSYTEFDITTPSARTADTRFRIELVSASTALDTDDGLTIEFDENGDIIRRENTTETDTTRDWAVSTTYRIRIEKQTTGWKATMTNLDEVPQVEYSLFTTTYEGHLDNYLEFQAYGGLWNVGRVVWHEGYDYGSKKAANAIVRYYREIEDNETIVFAHKRMYKYVENSGFTTLKSGLDIDAKYSFAIFSDVLYFCNGVDATQKYDGSNVSNLGTAPVMKYIHVHLQNLFGAGDPDYPNTLYYATAGDTSTWDTVDDIVDVDAWNGDIITGFVKIGRNLFIIKSSSVWELSGSTPATYQLHRVLGSQGCVAPYSIATNGIVAFWLGTDGVYRFDGSATVLVSYPIHPLFNESENSSYPVAVRSKMSGAVGVIHNLKYRLSLVQGGQSDLSYNNYEYVLDTLMNSGQGGWHLRSNRNAAYYAAFTGEGDDGELYYVPSDTSNTLYQAEVEDGNTRMSTDNVTRERLYDTNFIGRCVSRHFTAAMGNREFLDKQWNPFVVHYEHIGDISIGIKWFTKNKPQGQLFTFPMTTFTQDDDNLTVGIPLDGTYRLLENNYEDKYSSNISDVSDGSKGPEIWYEITQSSAVRTAVAYTGAGQRLGIGNFEPFRIRRVAIQFNEMNT